MQATQKRKAASSKAQTANIRPMIRAAAPRCSSQQTVSRQEKRKPTLAAKIFGAASTKSGWMLSNARSFLLIVAKGLYSDFQKPRMQKSVATMRIIHRSGLKRKSRSRATVNAAFVRATCSFIFWKDIGHIGFMAILVAMMRKKGLFAVEEK